MLHEALVILAAIAIVAYVIGRQLLGEPLRGKRLVLLPLVLTVIGAVDLGKASRHPQALDIVFIVVSGLVAAGIGLRQGAVMRLESRDGGLWGQMPLISLWLWGALVAARVLIGVIAGASGAHVAASTASVLLVLGINRLAQAAAIAPRAMKAGIPFAPEKDGSTFLGSMGTAHSASSTTAQTPTRTVQASAPTWQSTGQQMLVGLGNALKERRGQRRHGDRLSR